MGPLVLVGKGLVLGGLPSKNTGHWVSAGTYIFSDAYIHWFVQAIVQALSGSMLLYFQKGEFFKMNKMTHGLPFSGFLDFLDFQTWFRSVWEVFFEELFNQWRRYFSSKKCWKSSFNMIASVVVLPSEPVKGESNGSRCWHCLLQCLGEAVSEGQINAPTNHVFWMIF